MYNKRRTQGLSLEMIAIGAIAIVVLVIVITIFITSMQSSQKNLEEATEGMCEGKEATSGYEYKVLSHEECMNYGGSVVMGSFRDVNPLTDVCCLKPKQSN